MPNKVDTPPAICSYAPYAAVALLASAATPVAAAAVPAVNAFPITAPAEAIPFPIVANLLANFPAEFPALSVSSDNFLVVLHNLCADFSASSSACSSSSTFLLASSNCLASFFVSSLFFPVATYESL